MIYTISFFSISLYLYTHENTKCAKRNNMEALWDIDTLQFYIIIMKYFIQDISVVYKNTQLLNYIDATNVERCKNLIFYSNHMCSTERGIFVSCKN